jgi:hypothetical protein
MKDTTVLSFEKSPSARAYGVWMGLDWSRARRNSLRVKRIRQLWALFGGGAVIGGWAGFSP